MLNAKNNKQWEELKQSEKLNQSQRNGSAKSYIGCSDDFLKTLRENALVSFSQFGKMIWYDISSIDRFIQSNKVV